MVSQSQQMSQQMIMTRSLKPHAAQTALSALLWTLISVTLISLSCGGCAQVVRPLSPADTRLPSEAKQRIADAEDAVIIAQSRAQDARRLLDIAQARVVQFERTPPKLGSALGSARQLNSARLSLAELEHNYAEVDVKLSRSRLTLVYAQTSMRYDLAVYDLAPLDQAVDQQRKMLLKLRQERKGLRAELKKLRDDWWAAYQSLARGAGTQPYWVHEFGR